MIEEVEIIDYKVPLVDFDNTSTGARLTAEDIEKIGTRNLNAVINTQAGVFSSDDGAGLNIRGARTSDNAYFVNGVRVFSGSLPPVEAVEEMSVITGGVPAQYGDVIGGVVSITTKGPAARTSGSVQYETSRPLNQYNQDLLSVSASGPLLKTGGTVNPEDSTVSNRKTVLGYFATVQYATPLSNARVRMVSGMPKRVY